MDRQRLNKTIGANLAVRRDRRGISQKDLASLIRIHRTGLSKIEAGKQDLHCHLLLIICDVLGCNPEDILF